MSGKGVAIVLVGADGSGKTTVAREVCERLGARYVYLGTAIQSANYALPTARWLLALKLRRAGADAHPGLPTEAEAPRSDDPRLNRRFGGAARIAGLVNRVADEWYRWAVVRWFLLRGETVVCDRHFLFEYLPQSASFGAHRDASRWTDRLHLWLLANAYPRPHHVIHLDAPAEVLYARKGEWSLAHLAAHTAGLREQGAFVADYAAVDCSQPLDQVIEQVLAIIARARLG